MKAQISLIKLIEVIIGLAFLVIAVITIKKYAVIHKDIEGYKTRALDIITEEIYSCWNKYKGSLKAVVCYEGNVHISYTIYDRDILNMLDALKINKSCVKIEANITPSAKKLYITYRRGEIVVYSE